MDEITADNRLKGEFALPLALGHTIVGAGAGLVLFGLLFYFLPGVAAGLVLLLLGVLTAFHDPQHKFRFLKGFLELNSIWARRGIVFVGLTAFFGILYLSLQTGKPVSANYVTRLLGALSALITMACTGLFISSIAGVPLWNRRLVPVVFFLHSITSGYSALIFLVAIPAESYDSIYMVELIEMGLLSATFFFTVLHIVIMILSRNDGRESARLLVRGEQRYSFLLGAMLLGLIAPFALTAYLYFSFDFSAGVMFSVFLSIMISRLLGDLSFRYAFTRAGVSERSGPP